MNLEQLHPTEKEVSAQKLFSGEVGSATSIQLQEGGKLKEHLTKTPALLICISGLVRYEDETKKEIDLEPNDYIHIEPNVKHWLIASEKSQLILLK
ncbi:cupin domain-containing protein [Peijinzhouia sedimentorum]